ncbi:MAG: TraR/DksA C4-type zinc finger protein [Gammaproteobacteria bacterium]|nr:TraR/DksA C4-type zinc finger protein [Gammaproteobacteria bacterium]
MDEKYFEMAAKQEEMQRKQAIEDHKNRLKETPLIRGGARICKDCEGAIPFERVQRNPEVVRCVPCQEDHEMKGRQYGR